MSLSTLAAPKRRNRLTKAQYGYLDARLYEIAREYQPITVRGLFYQAEVHDLVPKDEKGYDVVQRRCLKMRYDGIMPYGWITDNSRSVYRLEANPSGGVPRRTSRVRHPAPRAPRGDRGRPDRVRGDVWAGLWGELGASIGSSGLRPDARLRAPT